MMSAAIPMAASVEQMVVSHASSDSHFDQGELEITTFAKSFNERVGDPAILQGKSSAGEPAIAKKAEAIADIPGGVKEKIVGGQDISAQSELKSAVGGKIVQPLTIAMTKSQEKVTAADPETKEVETPVPVEQANEDASAVALHTPDVVSINKPVNDDLVLFVKFSEKDQPAVVGDGRSVIQREIAAEGDGKEIVPAKKTVKTQESSVTSKAVQKTIETAATTTAKEITPTAPGVAANTIPSVGQPATAGVVSRHEIGKTTEGLSEGVYRVANPSAGLAPANADGPVRKEAAHETKAAVVDSETAVTGSDVQGALPKPGTDQEKIAAVVIPASTDGDGKTQSTPWSATAISHAILGGAGTSPGAVPVAAAVGNATGDLTVVKLPAASTGTHTAGLPNESRELDGAGVASPAMEGAPRMLTATPTALEVGIQNGTHGWLKVRAEMADGGLVNASVSAVSSSGQEMLHRELPALTAYLQQEKVVVNTVVVHTTAAAGSSSGMESRGGEQTPQESNEGGKQGQDVGHVAADRAEEATRYEEVGEAGLSPHATYAAGGSWLSVRA
jgi:hypothetical protein